MGMFQFENTYSCPVCGASTTKKENVNSRSVYEVGQCLVCGYERESKPSRTRNALSVTYLSIPSGATPREGVKRLAENAKVSISQAADILNPNSETTLADIQD